MGRHKKKTKTAPPGATVALPAKGGATVTPSRTCPQCGETPAPALELASKNVIPQPGDMVICFYCLEFNEFDGRLFLSPYTGKITPGMAEFKRKLEEQRRQLEGHTSLTCKCDCEPCSRAHCADCVKEKH